MFLRGAAVRLRGLPSGKQGKRAAKWLPASAHGQLAIHYGLEEPRLHLG